jgi:hypothetical protein
MIPTFDRPNVLSLLSFEGADCFDSGDSESIRFSTALEALEGMLDDCDLSWCGDATKYLETETLFCSLTAYKRMPVDAPERGRWSENLVEQLREWFGEGYGNEDGEDRLSDDDTKGLQARMRDITDWYLARVKVYSCEKLRTWTLDNADLLELVKQLRPDWLNTPEPASSKE